MHVVCYKIGDEVSYLQSFVSEPRKWTPHIVYALGFKKEAFAEKVVALILNDIIDPYEEEDLYVCRRHG